MSTVFEKQTAVGELGNCPDKGLHTACPSGFTDWHEWAEKKGRTHKLTRCLTCGFLAIWVPKS